MAFPVYFGTNRNPITSAVPNNFGTDFDPGGAVTFGRAVMQSVDDESELGNSNLTVDSLSPTTFLPALQKEIVNADPDHLLIYLHGFDYRFREVAMRAGILGQWFNSGPKKVASTILAFTWPSLGSLSIDAYKTDYRSSGASGGGFRTFLQAVVPIITAFKQADSSRRVSLMAHSMGNHFLRAGLQAAIGTAPGQIAPSSLVGLIDRIFLLASDEDADALNRPDGLTPTLAMCDRVYQYYNNMDIALGTFSRPIHGVGRLGIDGPPDKPNFASRNITFVNCSAANRILKNGQRQDEQWHQYYRLVPEVRDDICGAMRGMADADFPNRVFRKKENYYRLNLK